MATVDSDVVCERLSQFDETISLFRAVSRYCLVTNCPNVDTITGLFGVPWSKIFDFDIESLSKGILRRRDDVVVDRRPHLTTWNDKPKANEGDEVDWFFPRGYRERPETVCLEKKADVWETQVSTKLKMHCRTWAEQSIGSFRTVVVVLWYDENLSVNYFKLLALNLIFFLPKVKIIFCYDNLPADDDHVVRALKTILPKRFEIFNDVRLEDICDILGRSFQR
jgi:hypothetical protein